MDEVNEENEKNEVEEKNEENEKDVSNSSSKVDEVTFENRPEITEDSGSDVDEKESSHPVEEIKPDDENNTTTQINKGKSKLSIDETLSHNIDNNQFTDPGSEVDEM